MKFLKSVSIILFILFLATGCGSSGGDNNSNGNGNDGNSNYNLNGFVQKGTFIQGSTITIQELNNSLTPTGKTYSTVTNDDIGSYVIPITINSKYVEIIATGYYFDEVRNVLSSSMLTLRAISDLSVSDQINVNVLTHLARERIINLTNSGLSLADATNQAQNEILSTFGFVTNPLCQDRCRLKRTKIGSGEKATDGEVYRGIQSRDSEAYDTARE